MKMYTDIGKTYNIYENLGRKAKNEICCPQHQPQQFSIIILSKDQLSMTKHVHNK